KPTDPTESSTGDDTKPSEPVVDKGLLGDVNGDDKVNIKDATMIQKFAAKLIDLTDDEKLRADVNSDNKNNVKDATAIQKFVAKIETGFPIGKFIA
ncbi:MAG: dockerin type I repeat-containing protein, partial [Ruminococcus sp.]|nr:dockerin type I repeat-containing protein [Ruminococcus sp.]